MADTATETLINPKSYAPKEFPDMPYKVKEYYGFNDATKDNMNKKPHDYASFWNDHEVKEWFDHRDRIIGNNYSSRNFLLILMTDARNKKQPTDPISSVLRMYQPRHYLLPIEIKSKNKKNVDDVPEDAKAIARKFGGEVTSYKEREHYGD